MDCFLPRFPSLVLAAALIAATASAQQTTVPRVVRDAGPPLSTATDSELPDGDEVWESAQQALAQAANERDALAALVTVVNLQRRRGDYTEGLAGARDGLARARQLRDARLQVDFLYLLGRLYWNLTDYPHSLENHLEELRLAEPLGDASLLARTHGGLGLTYQRYGRNEDALQHFKLGLDLAVRAGDDRIRSSLLNSLGNYHLSIRNFDQATTIHEQALKLREGYGNRRAIAESLTNLGLIADARGDTAKALDYLQRALTTFETLKYRRYLANTHRRLALVLRKAGRTDEALAHLEKARQIAGTLESAEVLADLYQEFALTHEARGELPLALEFQRKQAAATDQMRGERDRQRMSELRARYSAEQRELEIALLKRGQELQNAEIARRRTQSLALGAGLVGGVLLLGAIIMLQRARLRAERRLHAATEHARERAEAAERLKSRLLQIASHDLKVPLTALNATAAMIGRDPTDDATVRRLAGGIQADTARMRSLVRDFLDAAAMEDGNLQLHAAEHDLGEIARNAVESLTPVAQAKGQRLIFHAAPAPLPKVNADAERLRQVFDNLIGNALKFTPPGGDVTIALGETPGWAFAEVRDSGPGLGPADFAKIFAPYQRLSAQPTGTGEDSTGLGLFIARELLTLQGGRLEVQSQPGRGAVFRVLLPVAAREPAARASAR
ncbi:MAG: two-component sensor histidine kinase [Opitutus sp.]|nr:two-component sensor histidine kinase [Opitutus sp.]